MRPSVKTTSKSILQRNFEWEMEKGSREMIKFQLGVLEMSMNKRDIP